MIYNVQKTLKILRKLRVPESLRKMLAVIALFSFSSAYAQEGKTILVLDASGSMWGKVEDGFKIKIAQDVINDLLETLPAEQELGLITYGHRPVSYTHLTLPTIYSV